MGSYSLEPKPGNLFHDCFALALPGPPPQPCHEKQISGKLSAAVAAAVAIAVAVAVAVASDAVEPIRPAATYETKGWLEDKQGHKAGWKISRPDSLVMGFLGLWP